MRRIRRGNAGCALLGIDPLYTAKEGKLIAAVYLGFSTNPLR
ncbi:Hypothetical protein Cul05146_0590 [Corynebacterium ulcerans]|nr:Hypothetical protein Cul05146_0590 [Corynebacterium ulcerans]